MVSTNIVLVEPSESVGPDRELVQAESGGEIVEVDTGCLDLASKRGMRWLASKDLSGDPNQTLRWYGDELESLAAGEYGKCFPIKCRQCRRRREGAVIFCRGERTAKYLWQHLLSPGHIQSQESLVEAPRVAECRAFSLCHSPKEQYKLAKMPAAVRRPCTDITYS